MEYYDFSDDFYDSDSSDESVEETCECGNDTPVYHSGLCEYCMWKSDYYSRSLEYYSIYNPYWFGHFRSQGRFITTTEKCKDETPKYIFKQAQRIIQEPKHQKETTDITEMHYLKYTPPPEPEPVEKRKISNWAGLFKEETEEQQINIYDILNLPKSSTHFEVKRAYRKRALKLMSDKKRSTTNEEKEEINEKYNTLEKLYKQLG